MSIIRICKYTGFVGFGMMLAAMIEYGAHKVIVFGIILSLLISALSTLLQGTMKEDNNETYVQFTA